MKSRDIVEYTFEVGLRADGETNYKTEIATAGGVYWGKEASQNSVVDGSLTSAVAFLAANYRVPNGYTIRDVRLVGMKKRAKNKRTVMVKNLRGKRWKHH
ncbi:MAG: hypothetical protein Q8P51_16280 [Ignavibacteria bacterium]|nr:hypothetical protein [Ignavibacteria bacterium]